MYNLNNSDLVLKALQVKDLTNLVSDLNYNFLQILNSPGFKGRPGIGIKGDDGESVRGSRWFFADSSKFILSYPADVSDPSSLTLQRINSLFQNSDETLFNTTLGLTDGDSIVLGDTIVLPDGQVCQVIEDNGTVIIGDSGITFKNTTSLTEDRVIELISQLSGSGSSSNQSGTFSIYSGVAKNYPDSSGSVNNSSNNDSAIDINSTGSGPGAPLNNNKYVAAKELSVTSNTLMCLIAGSVAKYHELIQKTQEVDTNESTPQVKDFPAFIALQNNYQSGLLFGHKDSASMKSFGRIYRSETSLNIASRSTNNTSEYTEANFKNTEILLRASSKVTLNTPTLDFSNTTVLLSPYINYASGVVDLGNDSSATKIYLKANSGVFLNNQTANRLISIDANKKIVSPYSVVTSYGSSSTHSQLLSALAIKNKFDSLDANITQDRLRIDALELSAGEDHFIKRPVQTGIINLNTLIGTGTYTIDINTGVQNWPTNYVSVSSLQNNSDFQTCTLNVFSSTNQTNASLHQELVISRHTPENTLVLKRSAIRTVSNQWSFGVWKNVTEKSSTVGVLGNPVVVTPTTGNNKQYTINHNTISQTTENRLAPDGVGIYDVELDAFGHPTKFKKQDFDNRYPTKTAYDANNITINQRITDLDDRYYTQTQLDTTINALIDRLVELEKTNAVFNSGNGSVWWRGTVESIPDGWIVDTSMAGFVPVGQKDGDADFGFLNAFGGSKTHQLTENEMPSHNHQWKFTKGVKMGTNSSQDGTTYIDQAQGYHNNNSRNIDRNPLNSSGSNIPHNNLQPYRVGVWIKRETV